MAPQQETKFNTSFIPKKPVNASSGPRPRIAKKGGNLFSTVGLFLFFLAAVGVAIVFLWKYQIENNIEKQIRDLQAARNEFDEQTIAQATRLNQRINAVEHLLDEHVAPSVIFSLLEDSTLETVNFNDLQYATNEAGLIDISGSGRARGFESVVLQSDELGRSDFRDVLFDDVQQNETGDGVTFSFKATIDKNVVLYRNNIDQQLSQENNVFDTPEESASAQTEIENDLEDKDIFR